MLKDVTPQGWLIGTVVIMAMLVASILIIMGAASGKSDLITTGIGIMLPILSAFGVYQVTRQK